MVEVLVIVDGASEPLRAVPSSLESAVTPVLDALVREGALSRVRTVAAGLPAGSESAIPALLGWTPPSPVDRGMLEAAARGVALGPGERAWRVDVLAHVGQRADDDTSAHAAAELQAELERHRVLHLAGHRLLVVGPPPLPGLGSARLAAWPEGVVPPRVLDGDTVVVGAAGAAIGAARLLGATTVVPPGATGDVDTDLAGKASAALDAIAEGATRVVVHVGAADEAAHRRDREAKVAAIERVDRELIAPLAAALRGTDGRLRVCPDHGCDPRTGLHDPDPVPCLIWPGAGSTGRLTERAAAELPAVAPDAREAVAA